MESESWEAEGHKSTAAERTWYRKWETVTSPGAPPPPPSTCMAPLRADQRMGRHK